MIGDEPPPGCRDVIGVNNVRSREVEPAIVEMLSVAADSGDGRKFVFKTGEDLRGQRVLDDEVRIGIRRDRTLVSPLNQRQIGCWRKLLFHEWIAWIGGVSRRTGKFGMKLLHHSGADLWRIILVKC